VLKKINPSLYAALGDVSAAHHHQLRRSRSGHHSHSEKYGPAAVSGLCYIHRSRIYPGRL